MFETIRDEAKILNFYVLKIKQRLSLSRNFSLPLSLYGILYEIFFVLLLKDFHAQVKVQPQFLYILF